MIASPCVLIDGAVPRSQRERCEQLLGFVAPATVAEIEDVNRWERALIACTDHSPAEGGSELVEIEDEILDAIASKLPDGLVLDQVVGGVVVCRAEEVES